MLFEWNSETIRWYISANEYTGFFKGIAEAVRPMIAGCGTLCDFGCGLALFDFEISPYVEKIDCYDLSEAALSSVTERLARCGIKNIYPHLEDCTGLCGQWDVAFNSFFGLKELDAYLPLCKKLIAVAGAGVDPDPALPNPKRNLRRTAGQISEYLTVKNIPYKRTDLELEFGQPFLSAADARRFIRTYSPEISEIELEIILSTRINETGRSDYPLYMPKTKPVCILELDGCR